jgi:hypothetical protein
MITSRMKVRRSLFVLLTASAAFCILATALLPWDTKTAMGLAGTPTTHNVVHLFTFGGLALWIGWQIGSRIFLPVVAFAVSLFGALTEWLEAHVYHFRIELKDIALDVASSLLGALLAWFLVQRRLRSREN